MRLVLLATISMLSCMSVKAKAEALPPPAPTAKCPYGEYTEDMVFVGRKEDAAKYRKGSCADKPMPESEKPEPQAPSGGAYDYEKVVMDEYGLTRRQARDWFDHGYDRAELPLQPITHGPGTKEYEVLQTIKKLSQAKKMADIVDIIGFSFKEPVVTATSNCMTKNDGRVDADVMKIKYEIGQYKIEYEVENSCISHGIYIKTRITYSNKAENTCIDYIDFNEFFGSRRISRNEPWMPYFDKNDNSKPDIYSNYPIAAEMNTRYVYPNYKTSKSCVGIISIALREEYRSVR